MTVTVTNEQIVVSLFVMLFASFCTLSIPPSIFPAPYSFYLLVIYNMNRTRARARDWCSIAARASCSAAAARDGDRMVLFSILSWPVWCARRQRSACCTQQATGGQHLLEARCWCGTAHCSCMSVHTYLTLHDAHVCMCIVCGCSSSTQWRMAVWLVDVDDDLFAHALQENEQPTGKRPRIFSPTVVYLCCCLPHCCALEMTVYIYALSSGAPMNG